MAASITHRGTGIILYGGTMLLAAWLFFLEFHPPTFSAITGFIKSPVGFIMLSGYIWALCFHLMNGLRHLYWDSGRGLAPKTATRTAWFVFIASFVLAAAALWAGVAARGAFNV